MYVCYLLLPKAKGPQIFLKTPIAFATTECFSPNICARNKSRSNSLSEAERVDVAVERIDVEANNIRTLAVMYVSTRGIRETGGKQGRQMFEVGIEGNKMNFSHQQQFIQQDHMFLRLALLQRHSSRATWLTNKTMTNGTTSLTHISS